MINRKREPNTVKGTCVKCGHRPQTSKGRNKSGVQVYRATCHRCHTERYDMPLNPVDRKRREYTRYKKNTCEECGFIPKHPCQLDCHHKDGNHENNEEGNIATLCANCHRLVHFG